MKIEQKKFSKAAGWEIIKACDVQQADFNLVFVFGSSELVKEEANYKYIKDCYPYAEIVINSTCGEIIDDQVNDDTLSVTAIHFEKTKLKTAKVNIDDFKDSYLAGLRLASEFDTNLLQNIYIISDGLKINGSDLIIGLQEVFPKDIVLTGGMAGDGNRYQTTLVGLNEMPKEGRAVAIGFYGSNLSVTYSSIGGWDSFGIERLITKSNANILYELDGKPALDIYKTYLGEYAKDLPGSALLFPLCFRSKESNNMVVRTILAINEKDRSLTFVGNMPEGTYVQLLKANFDRLINGASVAASDTIANKSSKPELAILISCIGRKSLLDQRIAEEVEMVRGIYGKDTALTGFYSYGEISPFFNFKKCELHNQTMAITAFSEE